MHTLTAAIGSQAVAATAELTTLQLVAKETVADGVVTLDLASPAGLRLRDWSPGGHVDLVLPNGMTRQYSLCGDRWDPFRYRVGVLREADGRGGSAYVHDELQVGDLVGVGGPRNNFPLAPSDEYLFVAGGIGITPLLPMVRQAAALGADWRLVYGGRRRGHMAFLDELAEFGDRVLVVPQDEAGLLDLTAALGLPRAGLRVYCCGPAPLLAAMEQACADLPPYTLRTERFVAEVTAGPSRSEPFEVELARSGRSVVVQPGTTVLDAVRDVGVDILSSCRQGVCGTCETTVLAGEPDHRDSLLDDADRQAGDCMMICVSRARSDRLVLDL